jgi:DNA-binding transcriptional ArsR family regulator
MTAAEKLDATFFALSDATRRDLLARLTRGDATVTELAAPYDMTLAAVSKHLKVLEGAGLVSRGRDAQFRPCRLEAEPLRSVAAWVEGYERFWTRNLDGLASHLETMKRGVPNTTTKTKRRPR